MSTSTSGRHRCSMPWPPGSTCRSSAAPADWPFCTAPASRPGPSTSRLRRPRAASRSDPRRRTRPRPDRVVQPDRASRRLPRDEARRADRRAPRGHRGAKPRVRGVGAARARSRQPGRRRRRCSRAAAPASRSRPARSPTRARSTASAPCSSGRKTSARRCSCIRGRRPGQHPPQPSLDQPLWWAALTGYVAEMQAAWLTFATVGRREHPRLRHPVRDAGRRRAAAQRAPGRRAAAPRSNCATRSRSTRPRATARWRSRRWRARVGAGQLLYGSDRPVVEPVPAAGWDAALQANAARFLTAARADTNANAVAA